MGINHGPLARPVCADTFAPMYPTAFHAVGPLHIGVHLRKDRLYVSSVKRLVQEHDEVAFFADVRGGGHALYPCTDSKNGCSKASAIQRKKRAASAPSMSR